MNEINDAELKQQLDTYLRALVPLEECLKTPPVSVNPVSSNEQQAEHSHRYHHSHRRANGARGKRISSI